MKKITAFMAFAIVLSSCSNDDDKKKEEEFFNLKVGNTWVYKRYTLNENQATYSNRNDTVRVVGTEIIDGEEYFKTTHTDDFISDELLRIDEKGHLITSNGYVVHPGVDKSYTFSRNAVGGENFGTISFSLKDLTKMTIEGKDYEVFPYSGYFVSSPAYTFPEGESVIDGYSKGIGFIFKKFRFISSATGFIEYRLSSYDLK